ncbi:MAG: ABC transporter substrate-binding protein [Planctomycetaceae bacterium]
MRGIRSVATVALAAFALVTSACSSSTSSSSGPGSSGASHEPVTITVWDYYGKATPFQDSVIKGFQAKYPWITVKHQDIGWDQAHNKFTVNVTSGTAPDVATMDMTWIPTFAANGLFEDLSQISGGQLNSQPITDQYTQGAQEAMTYNDAYVTMLFDFDVYALYYRADVFKQKGVDVPKSWDEMKAAAAKVAEDTNGDGTCDKYCFEVVPNDCFHWCQTLFQAGGSILSADSTQAAFNGSEGLSAMEYYKSFLDDGTGISWGTEQGDPMAGVKDGRIGMFQDGPYWMGLLKDGAPEMKGQWKVATAPYSQEPGSYLGGTGLSIPTGAPHPQEAWLFIQYMLEPAQQVGVYTYAGAAPATTAALQDPTVNKADPYFGGEAPFPVFMEAMSTATHFPYVAQWDDIDAEIGTMVETVMLGKASPQQGLDDGASKVNDLLASG